MNAFDYARPTTESEAVELLNGVPGESLVLAGGTDLMSLLRADLLSPRRVVDLAEVASLKNVVESPDGLLVGAMLTLDELRDHPALAPYASLRHVIDGVNAIQVTANGTLGGDLCLLPNCWYFRNGYGLLGQENGKSLVAEGRNEFHAILGNRGPAMFVSASRFAPALIAWGAKVRVVGPNPGQEELIPLEYFYVTPRLQSQGLTVLKPGQFVTHVWLPAPQQTLSAAYEALQMRGLDWPLAAAAVALEVSGGVTRSARIVLGHVAPTPWVAHDAAQSLVGKSVTPETTEAAAEIALARATPLSENEFKVTIARTAVARAILRAVGQWQEEV